MEESSSIEFILPPADNNSVQTRYTMNIEKYFQ